VCVVATKAALFVFCSTFYSIISETKVMPCLPNLKLAVPNYVVVCGVHGSVDRC